MENVLSEIKEKVDYLVGKAVKKDFPDGHIFTRAEIKKMSLAEYERNRKEIQRQEQAGVIK